MMVGARSGFFRLGAVVAVACTLAGVLTACGSSGGGAGGKQTIRFVWWGNDDRATATQQAVKLFEKANPNITVQTEFGAYDAYVQKLTTQIAGGAAPDVIQLDRPTFGEYVQKHALESLQPYLGKALNVSSVPAQLLSGEKSDGDQYAIPAGQTTQMIVYDATKFAKAGVQVPITSWTWQQFTDDLRKVHAATGVAGTTDFGWAIDWFGSWLHQHGKSLYTTDGNLNFTVADLTQFWTLTDNLRKQGLATSAQVTTKMDGSTQNSALVAGQSASEENYDSNLTGYLAAYNKGKLQAAPVPSDSTTATASGMAALPPVYFAVPRTSSHKDAAVKLLDFLVNNTNSGATLGATRGVPENTTIRKSVCAKASPGDKAVCSYEQKASSKIGPSAGWFWPSGSSSIKTDFQQVYDNVIFGKSSVADAAKQLVSDAQQSLGK